MKKKSVSFLCLPFLLLGITACRETPPVSHPAKVELASPFWSFTPSQPALSHLSQAQSDTPLSLTDDPTEGFTIRLQAVDKEQILLQIPHVLAVRLRPHDPEDRSIQNYPAHKMPDGSVPVLEASLSLQSPSHPETSGSAGKVLPSKISGSPP